MVFGEERIVLQIEEKSSGKREKFKLLLINVFYIVVGIVCGFGYISITGSVKEGQGLSIPEFLILLVLSIIVSIVLHIAFHELGHVITGKLTGYGFYSYRLFSFMFLKEDGKWKCKRYTIPGTMGQAIMTPPEKKNGEYPWFWYNAGGGLMNFLVSLIVWIMYLLLPGRTELKATIIIPFIFIGVVLGLTNLIPSPRNMLANDGSNILALYKDKIARDCFYQQLTVIAHLAKKKSFSDLPLEFYQLPGEANLTYPIVANTKFHELEYYYDVQAFGSAIHLLNALAKERSISRHIRLSLDIERVFMECMQGPRKDIVEALCTKDLRNIFKASKNVPDIHRVLMAYEGLYNRDTKKAMEHYEKACRLLQKYPLEGIAKIETKLLALVKSQLEKMTSLET